jgi:hypothetical protein
MRLALRRLFGSGAPAGLAKRLAPEEHVLAVAEVTGGGEVVATSLGLWLPQVDERVGWHLVSKATWATGALTVIAAEEDGRAGDAVLLRDLPARRFELDRPGKLPRVVQTRVNLSIRSRHRIDLSVGGAWFVQRVLPGGREVVLQVRADAGADRDAVVRLAEEVSRRIEAGGQVE